MKWLWRYVDDISVFLRSVKTVSVKAFPIAKSEFFLNHQQVFLVLFQFKNKMPYWLGSSKFTNFSVVDAMLPITAKHAGI